ncbi:MAG: DinB family protein [Planctomycetaceae bacterium]
MSRAEQIDAYLAGPLRLRDAVAGMTDDELDARPIAGKMSTREVVCHVADFEPVYADRMKRVLAEDSPPLRGGDPDVWAKSLAYALRDMQEELELIDAVRKQMARILRTVPESAWSRVGIHDEAGPLALEELLRRITGHIPHHVAFIDEKRKALASHR